MLDKIRNSFCMALYNTSFVQELAEIYRHRFLGIETRVSGYLCGKGLSLRLQRKKLRYRVIEENMAPEGIWNA